MIDAGTSLFGKLTRVITCDDYQHMILDAYCSGKSAIFNKFAGWKETRKDNTRVYLIPTEDVEFVAEIIDDFKKSL